LSTLNLQGPKTLHFDYSYIALVSLYVCPKLVGCTSLSTASVLANATQHGSKTKLLKRHLEGVSQQVDSFCLVFACSDSVRANGPLHFTKMNNMEGDILAERLTDVNEKLEKTCAQIRLIENKIRDFEQRYKRALTNKKNSFRYKMRLRLVMVLLTLF